MHDTQIYIHSEPGDYTTIAFLERCVSEIKVWMAQNYLCLNGGMLIGSSNQLRKAGYATINIDGSVLEFQKKLKNLCVIFDAHLTFEPHVQNTVKTSFFHLKKHCRITSYAICYDSRKIDKHLRFLPH